MPLTQLNHVFVRAQDLEKSKDFYVDVLGMQVIDRPIFPFPGYWLGFDGGIQIHMGRAGIPNEGLYYPGTTPKSARDNSGVIDHVAFLATMPEQFIARFESNGIAARAISLPESNLYQLFVRDPNGITIELNFYGLENVPDWGGAGGEKYGDMPRVE